MRIVRFQGRKVIGGPVRIGVETDNRCESLRFDLPQIAPGQTACLYWRHGDSGDAVMLEDGVWTVERAVTQFSGALECFVRISAQDDVVWNSQPFCCVIAELPSTEATVEQAYPTAIQQGIDAAAAAASAAEAARDAAEASAQGVITEETARQAAEQARAAGWIALKAQAEKAVSDANSASGAANQAVMDMKTAMEAAAGTLVEAEGLSVIDRLCPALDESGGVVRCAPVEDYPLSVVSRISAVQSGSGDPSPDNIRPISGWNAARLEHFRRNLLDVGLFDGMAVNGFSVKADRDTGTIAVTALRDASNITFASIKIPLKAGQAYVFSASLDGAPNGLVNCDVLDEASGLRVSVINMGQTFTAQSGRVYSLKFYNNRGENSVSAGEQKIYARCGLYLANGDNAFEPYAGASYAAELPETVFGGELDWTGGALTSAWGLAALTGEEACDVCSVTGDGFVVCRLSGGRIRASDSASAFCSHFPIADSLQQIETGEGLFLSPEDGGEHTPYLSLNAARLSSADAEGVRAYLAAQHDAGTPVQIGFALAEPRAVRLEPVRIRAMAGLNTFCSDTGDTSVAGRADPARIMADMLSRIAALETAG